MIKLDAIIDFCNGSYSDRLEQDNEFKRAIIKGLLEHKITKEQAREQLANRTEEDNNNEENH